jgi:hypothetical protein
MRVARRVGLDTHASVASVWLDSHPPTERKARKMTTAPDHGVTPDHFAAQLTDRLLHCRELGHTWRAWGVSQDRKARCFIRTTRCASCRTLRHWVIDYSGHVVSSHYTYPDGYLAKHVVPGFSRDPFRLEAIQRELAKPRRVAS